MLSVAMFEGFCGFVAEVTCRSSWRTGDECLEEPGEGPGAELGGAERGPLVAE